MPSSKSRGQTENRLKLVWQVYATLTRRIQLSMLFHLIIKIFWMISQGICFQPNNKPNFGIRDPYIEGRMSFGRLPTNIAFIRCLLLLDVCQSKHGYCATRNLLAWVFSMNLRRSKATLQCLTFSSGQYRSSRRRRRPPSRRSRAARARTRKRSTNGSKTFQTCTDRSHRQLYTTQSTFLVKRWQPVLHFYNTQNHCLG